MSENSSSDEPDVYFKDQVLRLELARIIDASLQARSVYGYTNRVLEILDRAKEHRTPKLRIERIEKTKAERVLGY